MDDSVREITTLLQHAHADREAREALFRAVEQRFQRLAKALLRAQRPDPMLESMLLVDDTFVRLVRDEPGRWKNQVSSAFLPQLTRWLDSPSPSTTPSDQPPISTGHAT